MEDSAPHGEMPFKLGPKEWGKLVRKTPDSDVEGANHVWGTNGNRCLAGSSKESL